jgi:purine-binding chemotaxis protein CheW
MPATVDTRSEAVDAKKDRAEKVDFKMVTFSLAGKEYGIDIMSVKEIAKAGRFTYVPNAAPFVRGVYNLRGDIISVIDLRIFFHLPAERKSEDAFESLLILRIDEHVFGVIVDEIDKVVGISASSIQPPHPIFGDINVKYIKGIVENGGKLYIILDVARIFSPEHEEEAEAELQPARGRPAEAQGAAAPVAPAITGADQASGFIGGTLAAFKRFYVSALNESWFEGRFAEWKRERAGQDVQLHEPAEADEFISQFWSPCTGKLWEDDYVRDFMATLPDLDGKSINIWNPGCGKGFETWSLACALRKRYPEIRLKIWANDSDLLAISMAPNMVFPENVPDFYQEFMVRGMNGLSFVQAVRDSIFFEFHDALNPNPLPPLDMILCRDVLSLLPQNEQKRMLDDFSDKLKPAGLLYLGANERPGAGWGDAGTEAVPAYRKES